MQTQSSSRLTRDQSSNPTSSKNTNSKGRNRRGSKQRVENSNLEEQSPPVVTMTDQRTMAELLRVPTEGYAEAIIVPPILAEQFKLKHSLINMMTTDQFFGLEKDNPHDHIRCLRNKISNFQQRFDESFHEAWDRYKDLLRACPHYGFTELHQLDTFYNALNPADQDSLNAAAGGNLLEKSTQDVLTIIENKSKVRNSRSKLIVSPLKACDVNSNSEMAKLTHAVNQQTSAMTTAMTAMLKQFQATPPPALVKAVEEICVTCGGAHPYYQCLAAGGNTFSELRDNIKGYVSVATVNYNQGNPGYRPYGIANQIRPPGFAQPNVQNNQTRFGPPQGFNHGNNFNHEQSYQATAEQNQNVHLNELEKIKRMNEANMKAMQTQIDMVKNELRNEMKSFIQTSFGLVIDRPTVPTPPKSINPEVDECVEETFTDPDLAEYTIKVPPPPKLGLPELIPTRMTLELANRAICTPAGIARDVFVPVGKFTFPADFVIVDYESDPRFPLILGRPFLRNARALIDVHGEEMILRDELTSPEVNNDIFDLEGCNFLSEKLPDLDSTKNLYPPIHDNPLSEIEFLLYQDKDFSLKDSIDQKNRVNLADIFVDSTPEMFTDEHTLDYSSPSIFDVYDDDFLDVESDAGNVYDDHFDSKGEKIKESKLLIDELDLPCDFRPPSEYDLDKKLAISNAFLVLEDFDPLFYEPLFFKKVPKSKIIIPPKRRSQTNPQPTLTQEAADQLVRDGIEAAIRAERERVTMEETRAGGPAGGPAAAPVARECSFTGFIKCGPMQFHGTKGAVGLVRWFEKIEKTFEISECTEGKKVKFATATLHGQALTWWNSQVPTLGHDAANGRPWTEVKQLMTDEFCPTEEF
nr:hypothetical protein [Tanacetum cinerariifolium]